MKAIEGSQEKVRSYHPGPERSVSRPFYTHHPVLFLLFLSFIWQGLALGGAYVKALKYRDEITRNKKVCLAKRALINARISLYQWESRTPIRWIGGLPFEKLPVPIKDSIIKLLCPGLGIYTLGRWGSQKRKRIFRYRDWIWFGVEPRVNCSIHKE
ncbi:hypothetical protein ACFL35_09175 [Candidatus Riflebacteria bacterium]